MFFFSFKYIIYYVYTYFSLIYAIYYINFVHITFFLQKCQNHYSSSVINSLNLNISSLCIK